MEAFMKNTKKTPWKRIGLIALCSFLAVALVLMICATAFIQSMLNKINRIDPNETQLSTLDPTAYATDDFTLPPDFSDETMAQTEPQIDISQYPVITDKSLINIMLVGQDRRPGETGNTRSDAMILCSFNLQDNTFTMTSFLRDTYVSIPGASPQKLNAAFAIGGSKLLSQTLLNNFGVQIDGFFIVDFTGFEEVIDTLGGVDMELTQAEVNYMVSRWGHSLTAGVNRLNGEEALNYCRIRAIGDDWERTNRQRKTISSILTACSGLSLDQAYKLINQLLPFMTTDLSNSQIMSYAATLFPVLISGNLRTQRIPCDGSWKYAQIGPWDCIYCDLEMNRNYLYETLMPK